MDEIDNLEVRKNKIRNTSLKTDGEEKELLNKC